jgi:hypothetical protein
LRIDHAQSFTNPANRVGKLLGGHVLQQVAGSSGIERTPRRYPARAKIVRMMMRSGRLVRKVAKHTRQA